MTERNQLLELAGPDPDALGPRTGWHDVDDAYQEGARLADQLLVHPAFQFGHLPMQALARYMDPQGTSRFWRPVGVGERKFEEFSPAAQAIGNQLMTSGYQPGERESQNAVVDYRLLLPNPFDALERKR